MSFPWRQTHLPRLLWRQSGWKESLSGRRLIFLFFLFLFLFPFRLLSLWAGLINCLNNCTPNGSRIIVGAPLRILNARNYFTLTYKCHNFELCPCRCKWDRINFATMQCRLPRATNAIIAHFAMRPWPNVWHLARRGLSLWATHGIMPW